jgi:hypothetical protein
MTRRQRRQVVLILITLVGLAGLGLLYVTLRPHFPGGWDDLSPLAQRGVWALVAWQGFWYVVRLVLMVLIWRREAELTPGEKLWMAFTAPVAVIFAVYLGRGKISEWICAGQPVEDET